MPDSVLVGRAPAEPRSPDAAIVGDGFTLFDAGLLQVVLGQGKREAEEPKTLSGALAAEPVTPVARRPWRDGLAIPALARSAARPKPEPPPQDPPRSVRPPAPTTTPPTLPLGHLSVVLTRDQAAFLLETLARIDFRGFETAARLLEIAMAIQQADLRAPQPPPPVDAGASPLEPSRPAEKGETEPEPSVNAT